MAEGGPKLKNQWGSNNIEVVPISLGNPHVHGEIQIQKNNLIRCSAQMQLFNTSLIVRSKVSAISEIIKMQLIHSDGDCFS